MSLSPNQQQRYDIPTIPKQTQKLPTTTKNHNTTKPQTLPTRKRTLQPNHHIRTKIVPQHTKKTKPTKNYNRQKKKQL